jgi:hypothetical protein
MDPRRLGIEADREGRAFSHPKAVAELGFQDRVMLAILADGAAQRAAARILDGEVSS